MDIVKSEIIHPAPREVFFKALTLKSNNILSSAFFLLFLESEDSGQAQRPNMSVPFNHFMPNMPQNWSLSKHLVELVPDIS